MSFISIEKFGNWGLGLWSGGEVLESTKLEIASKPWIEAM